MVPPAPPTFSTRTGVRRDLLMVTPRSRATVSVGPPAAKGTTTVIGFCGYSAATALATVLISATRARAPRRVVVMFVLLADGVHRWADGDAPGSIHALDQLDNPPGRGASGAIARRRSPCSAADGVSC